MNNTDSEHAQQVGTLTAHGRSWPLYGRDEVREGRKVMVVELSPEDRAEKEALDEQAIRRAA